MPTADELKDQGIRQFMQQDFEQSVETFQQARAAYEEAGQAEMAAEQQVNLGLALHSLGQYDAALEQMQAALAVFRAANDSSRTAQALGNMARVYAKMGNSEQAITNYREASAMFMEIGDEDNYGQTVLAIADLQLRSGNLVQAAATYEVGLEYVKKLNARQKIMKGLLNVRNRIAGTGMPKGDPKEDGDA
jgi:tetratricopeptide (TPR) repeat protein